MEKLFSILDASNVGEDAPDYVPVQIDLCVRLPLNPAAARKRYKLILRGREVGNTIASLGFFSSEEKALEVATEWFLSRNVRPRVVR